MSLREQLQFDVKEAMKARDSARLGTLRLLQAAIKQKEVDERRELPDAEIISVIEKQVKQRRESALAFEQAGRVDQAASERAEIEVLSVYLPQAATEAEIAAIIADAVAAVQAAGASGPAAMGQVMARVKPALAGRADLSAVSASVKAALA